MDTNQPNHTDPRKVLQRYPRLIAHMICESLGYFTVMSAAHALCAHIDKRPAFNEWYLDMASKRGDASNEALTALTTEVVKWAFEGRHRHNGYMASYKQALQQVAAELKKEGATAGMFAAWF